ncbi:MAG: Uma2 family endonuclease [Myxococcaceae bacterium]|jgi:Uma2 family endonuclease|nr:Uma2 family endonuclease [Myxococcaceae bacterium]
MSMGRRVHATVQEYLAVEARSDLKHEYYDGEIFAMAGGTPEHAWLAAQLIGQLGNQLPKTCRVASSDLRVSIERTGLLTYPDASVIRGPPTFDAREPHAVTNPLVLAEVTSPSSEDYDRGEKLSHYKQIIALACVIILSHTARRLTVVERTAQGWATREFRGGETAELLQPSLRLEVDALYAVTSIP